MSFEYLFDPSLDLHESLNEQIPSSVSFPHFSVPNDSESSVCVRCQWADCDVKLEACGCCFHARCFPVNTKAPSKTCPNCMSNVSQISIFPMSFQDIDNAQSRSLNSSHSDFSTKGGKKKRRNSVLSDDISDGPTETKRIRSGSMSRRMSFDDSQTVNTSSSTNNISSHDINSENRTGRWTTEEIVFCDKITALFKDGKLPLKTGTKLNDFLASMLKSKPSRLTKKMKNAKLSSNLFSGKECYISNNTECAEFSHMEYAFFQSIADSKERAHLKFHIRKEWRELFCAFCQEIGQPVVADAWLNSVEEMDRRASASKNAARIARRKLMMGYAFSQDIEAAERGVHIESSDSEFFTAGITEPLKCSSYPPNGLLNTGNAGPVLNQYETDEILGLLNDDTFLDLDEPAGTSFNIACNKAAFDTENNDLNFEDLNFSAEDIEYDVIGKSSILHSSPFLSKVISYIKRYHVPFEHIDVWVPNSTSDNANRVVLGFAGCATSDFEIVDSEKSRQVSLDSEDKFNFVSFGDYSQKFSFSDGCGLPGRVFESGNPIWQENVLDSSSCSFHFERSGGASQWGIQTVVGIPLVSPNVGRIVLCLYSRHVRPCNNTLVAKLTDEFTRLVPTPRWKLVIDMNSPTVDTIHPKAHSFPISTKPADLMISTSHHEASDVAKKDMDDIIHTFGENVLETKNYTEDIIQLLGVELSKHMKSEASQADLHSLTGLRLLLIRTNRAPHEEEIASTIIGSYSSYIGSGSAISDVAQMLVRDYAFLIKMHRASLTCTPDQPQPSPILSASYMSPPVTSYNYDNRNNYFNQTPCLAVGPLASSKDNHSVASAKDNLSVVSN
jgi:hypothetical protein